MTLKPEDSFRFSKTECCLRRRATHCEDLRMWFRWVRLLRANGIGDGTKMAHPRWLRPKVMMTLHGHGLDNNPNCKLPLSKEGD